jgi:hypothetical protein
MDWDSLALYSFSDALCLSVLTPLSHLARNAAAGDRQKFTPLLHQQTRGLSRVVAGQLPFAVAGQAVVAVFDGLFAVWHQDAMGPGGRWDRTPRCNSATRPVASCTCKAGLYGSPGLLLRGPIIWFGETSGCLFAKMLGRLLGSLLNSLQAHLNQYLVELLVPNKGLEPRHFGTI